MPISSSLEPTWYHRLTAVTGSDLSLGQDHVEAVGEGELLEVDRDHRDVSIYWTDGDRPGLLNYIIEMG